MSSATGIEQSIVLVGFMAAGKSKIGGALAARLSMAFADVDKSIEAEHGCSVADIFRDRGEAAFRDAERAVILRLLAGQPQVIAVGGGAFIDSQNRHAINQGARTVWLDTPFELVIGRLKGGTKRPLAANKTEAELKELWEHRSKAYQEAHVRIDTSDADVDKIVDRIVTALG